MRERRAYVWFALIMLVFTVFNILFTIQTNKEDDHKFCQLIVASLGTTAPKPANPKTDPSRAKLYEDYLIVLNLGRSLGCV